RVTVAPGAAYPGGREIESRPIVTHVDRRLSPPRRYPEPIVFCVPSAMVTTSCRACAFAGTGVTSVTPLSWNAFETWAPEKTTGPQLCQGEERSYGSGCMTRYGTGFAFGTRSVIAVVRPPEDDEKYVVATCP